MSRTITGTHNIKLRKNKFMVFLQRGHYSIPDQEYKKGILNFECEMYEPFAADDYDKLIKKLKIDRIWYAHNDCRIFTRIARGPKRYDAVRSIVNLLKVTEIHAISIIDAPIDGTNMNDRSDWGTEIDAREEELWLFAAIDAVEQLDRKFTRVQLGIKANSTTWPPAKLYGMEPSIVRNGMDFIVTREKLEKMEPDDLVDRLLRLMDLSDKVTIATSMRNIEIKTDEYA